MKYYVSVTETLNKVVCVEAENEKRALETAQNAYDNGNIVLDSDNFCGAEIEIEDDQDLYRENESDRPYYQKVKA